MGIWLKELLYGKILICGELDEERGGLCTRLDFRATLKQLKDLIFFSFAKSPQAL